MRFVLIFIFVALPCLDTYGITKVYNIIDRKLKIHTYEPLTVDQKKKIEKKIDQILDVLNEYENQNYSVIMASVPIGIIHMATYISQFDWVENKKYHLVK